MTLVIRKIQKDCFLCTSACQWHNVLLKWCKKLGLKKKIRGERLFVCLFWHCSPQFTHSGNNSWEESDNVIYGEHLLNDIQICLTLKNQQIALGQYIKSHVKSNFFQFLKIKLLCYSIFRKMQNDFHQGFASLAHQVLVMPLLTWCQLYVPAEIS